MDCRCRNDATGRPADLHWAFAEGKGDRGDRSCIVAGLQRDADGTVQQNTSVYASTSQANTWWKRTVTPSFVTCAAGTFAALRAKGVKVALVSSGKLSISTALQHTAGYRVVATANGRKLYFDLIVLATGRTITAVTISSFLQPVPARYEQPLATLVVRKLEGSGAA